MVLFCIFTQIPFFVTLANNLMRTVQTENNVMQNNDREDYLNMHVNHSHQHGDINQAKPDGQDQTSFVNINHTELHTRHKRLVSR